jgi:hypothetical protein
MASMLMARAPGEKSYVSRYCKAEGWLQIFTRFQARFFLPKQHFFTISGARETLYLHHPDNLPTIRISKFGKLFNLG